MQYRCFKVQNDYTVCFVYCRGRPIVCNYLGFFGGINREKKNLTDVMQVATTILLLLSVNRLHTNGNGIVGG